MHLVSSLWPFVVGLGLLLQATSRQTPPRDPSAPLTGTASVSGRVVAGDTGVPQREAAVVLVSRELRVSRRTTTDEQGRYAFVDLPAGRYALNVAPARHRPRYLPTSASGDPRDRLVDLADGQEIEHLDVALDRAGAMTGRVVDELGEPLANVRVYAQSPRSDDTVRTSGGTSTDDYGRFRIFGMRSGEYLLQTEGPAGMSTTGSDDPGEGYLPTYYPGTTNRAEAPVLKLGRGEELTDLEIRLVRSRTFRITGLVFGLDGTPAGGVLVRCVQGRADGSPRSSTGITRPDGTFQIANLAPGEYVLFATSLNPSGGESGDASAPVRVAISSTDMDNLTLSMTAGVTLRGQIVTDQGAVPAFRPGGLRMMASADIALLTLARSQGEVLEDWTFEITGVRAPVVLRPQGRMETGYRLMGVYYRGVEISDDFTEFAEPTTPRELQIVIGNRGASLSGTITDAAGRPVPLAGVALFPAERTQRSLLSVRNRAARADESGHYTLDVLPPGDYLVAVVTDTSSISPTSFDALAQQARPVTLQRDEQKTMALRVPERR